MDYSNATNEQLEQLVNQKDGDAICELGHRCLRGTKGHAQNLTRAYQLFHKGEKRGLARAYLGLAEMYKEGIYFAKNDELAAEYYQKAGMGVPIEPAICQSEAYSTSEAERIRSEDVPVFSAAAYPQEQRAAYDGPAEIRNKIQSAEYARQNQDFRLVRKECEEALHMLAHVRNGAVSYSGSEDFDRLEADAYWVLAFTAFNEQRVSELEDCMSRGAVQALHPWGVYLVAVMHKSTKAPDIVMEQDLQNLMMICQNQNLTVDEEGDVCVMIGDLIAEGFGKAAGCTPNMAYEYYQRAAGCGNEYAKEKVQER